MHPLVPLLLVIGPLWLLIVFFVLSILAFEIWMFVDAIRNPHMELTEKTLWLVGMFLIHPFVAIVYYFYSRSPARRAPRSRA